MRVGRGCSKLINIGQFGKGGLRVANGPGGVVKFWGCRRWIGRDANPPALVEQQWRTQFGGVDDCFRHTRTLNWKSLRGSLRLQGSLRRQAGGRLLGNQLHRSASGDGGDPQNDSAQGVPPLLLFASHFNAERRPFQEKRAGKNVKTEWFFRVESSLAGRFYFLAVTERADTKG